MKFATRIGAASTIALLVGASGALAVPLQLGNISLAWQNPQNGVNVVVGAAGNPTSIDWGTGGTSGYDIGTPDPVPAGGVGADVPFIVGQFTHRNQSINSGTAITGVQLAVNADVLDLQNGAPGQSVDSVQFLFDFAHNETPNNGNCAPPNPQGSNCDDIVTVTLANFSDTFIGLDNIEYTLSITGFLQGGILDDTFYSAEGGGSTGEIQAIFTADIPNQVPLPAAGWLLLAGVGGIAAVRRKKKAA